MASEIVIDGTLLTSIATNAYFIIRMFIDRRKSDAKDKKDDEAWADFLVNSAAIKLPCGKHGERLATLESKVDAHATAVKEMRDENGVQHGRIFAILDDIRSHMISGK
jgi:hypothetical protein